MMTDEQIKDLVKWARMAHLAVSDTITNYPYELLVKICYDMNKELDKCYPVSPDLYSHKRAILLLVSEWLKGDETIRKILSKRLKTERDMICPHNKMSGLRENHIMTSTAYMADCISYDFDGSLIDYQNRVALSIYYADDVFREYQINTKHILIKTILEYYGEDFETFKVLYL